MTRISGRAATLALGVRDESGADGDDAELFLVIVDPPGPLLDRSIPLNRPQLLIGRDETADICLEQEEISRRHAVITYRGDGHWVIDDLASTNGTYVDGTLIERAPLLENSTLQIGLVVAKVVSQTSLALETSRRDFETENIDQTTGLPNRRWYERAIERVKHREAGPDDVAVLLIKIDQLEQINDRFGREAGDTALRECAARLRQLNATLLCRYDGRFVLLQEDADQGQAEDLAKKAQKAIEACEVNVGAPVGSPRRKSSAEPSDPVRVRLTASVGGAQCSVTSSFHPPALIDYANRALRDVVKNVGEGGVVVEGISTLPPVADGLTQLLPLVQLEARLRVGMRVMVAGLEQRRVLKARHPTEVGKLDRAFEEAAHIVVAKCEEGATDSTVPIDRSEIGSGATMLQLGRPPGGDYVVLAVRAHINPTEIATSLATEFEQLRSKKKLPAAEVICGESVKVTGQTRAIAGAVAKFEDRCRTSERDRRLPLSIAWAHRKTLSSDRPMQAFWRLRDLHQTITRWLFSILAAEQCRLSSTESPDNNRLRDVLARSPSEGTWVALVRRLAHQLGGRTSELVAPELVQALNQGRKSDVLNELEAFVPDRNAIAHGGEHRAAELVAAWKPRLDALLEGPLKCLERLPAREICDIRRLRRGGYEVRYRELVGDHIVIAPRISRMSEGRTAGEVALLNERTRAELRLQPFLTYGRCPQCELHEVFFLDKLVGEVPVYTSLREGRHTIQSLTEMGRDDEEARDLQEELHELLDRL